MEVSQNNFFTTSDGIHLYYEDRGSGQTLVMIPGFLCTCKFFEKNAIALSKKYRVITIDPRGQGFSSKTALGNNLKRHALDIKELVDHLSLDSFVLLGWSLASSVVVTYASNFSQHKLAGLVLMDGSLFPFSGDDWNHHRGKNYNVENWHNVYMELETNRTNFNEKFFDRIGLQAEDREWVTAECAKTLSASAIELHYDFSHTNNVDTLHRISVPTAFFGAQSKAYGLDMVEFFASKVSGYSKVVKFYESGHLMFMYEADKFNRELSDFIEEIHPI
ncbi:alpha/beta hydrolase [Bengtsoniella intestinalis]|uniref:alpha/beta fold hydrolase n=1 Tax=Bengtsoniella intestinalis TaxID=3073143 RepID=UPI00391F164B